LEIAKEAAALADHHQQAAARVMVLAVGPQVLCELVDPLGEKGDLDLGRAGVAVGPAELADQLLLSLLGKAHARRTKLAHSSLASATSRCICAISSSEPGNRRSPRNRAMNAIRRVWP